MVVDVALTITPPLCLLQRVSAIVMIYGLFVHKASLPGKKCCRAKGGEGIIVTCKTHPCNLRNMGVDEHRVGLLFLCLPLEDGGKPMGTRKLFVE
jgi:hypothetical protein